MEIEEGAATLEEIAAKVAKTLDKQMEYASNTTPGQTDVVEKCTRNALLLTHLLKELAELRALRG